MIPPSASLIPCVLLFLLYSILIRPTPDQTTSFSFFPRTSFWSCLGLEVPPAIWMWDKPASFYHSSSRRENRSCLTLAQRIFLCFLLKAKFTWCFGIQNVEYYSVVAPDVIFLYSLKMKHCGRHRECESLKILNFIILVSMVAFLLFISLWHLLFSHFLLFSSLIQ